MTTRAPGLPARAEASGGTREDQWAAAVSRPRLRSRRNAGRSARRKARMGCGMLRKQEQCRPTVYAQYSAARRRNRPGWRGSVQRGVCDSAETDYDQRCHSGDRYISTGLTGALLQRPNKERPGPTAAALRRDWPGGSVLRRLRCGPWQRCSPRDAAARVGRGTCLAQVRRGESIWSVCSYGAASSWPGSSAP